MGHVKHSITLYGFGDRYVSGAYTFEDILVKAKKLGGDGIEVVAPQMVPGHPNPSEEWISYFKDACENYELDPVCYSIYVDSGKHKNRFLYEHERLAESIHEMETAKRLGFKIVRSQDALLPTTMEKLLPYAEALGIHLAVEMHGPWHPSAPLFQQYLELFRKADSPYLGVVPDFSAFNSCTTDLILNSLPADCFHKDILIQANECLATTEIPVDEIEQMILNMGGDELDIEIFRAKLAGTGPNAKMKMNIWRTHPEFDGFRDFLKYTKYVHGKFWFVDENYKEKSVMYPQFIKIMKEERFNGFIASEYEGSMFDPTISDEDQIARHIIILEKLWEAV